MGREKCFIAVCSVSSATGTISGLSTGQCLTAVTVWWEGASNHSHLTGPSDYPGEMKQL